MRIALSLIAALTVLYHLTVGCCGHHAHGDEVVLPSEHVHHGHVHSHGRNSVNDLPTPAPAHDDCHDGHCHVVVPLKVAPPDQPAVSLDQLNIVRCVALPVRHDAGDFFLFHPPPLFGDARCYLVLQHLLI